MKATLSGTCSRPLENGQMPANERNSVDLPLPEGPCSSTLSPGFTASAAPASSGVPSGSATPRSSLCSTAAGARCSASSCVAWAVMLSSKLVRRSVVARHTATLS